MLQGLRPVGAIYPHCARSLAGPLHKRNAENRRVDPCQGGASGMCATLLFFTKAAAVN